MITARFFYAGKECAECTVTGHADYAEEGSDIVCASVTAAVQTVANLLTEIYKLPVTVDTDDETGTISIRQIAFDFPGNIHKLLEGLKLELQLLSDAYPAHIQLIDMEV